MNKTEFVNAVAAKAGFSKVSGKKAIKAVIETISEEVEKGGKVNIIGFGSFYVTTKAARKGINPATQQVIQIPARKVVKFKVGADLAKVVK
ncbi:MAG: HU family DNA-binding protein [Tannerella sp.]|jgi:DNA-binding protein HU-beta|nr:HU family DNA-binding protein [Tannerella sp.]